MKSKNFQKHFIANIAALMEEDSSDGLLEYSELTWLIDWLGAKHWTKKNSESEEK